DYYCSSYSVSNTFIF
nr:immunoglobulin light chain junction region [Macaca mulatta]MOW04127.1 immunoglobulin light chain junction region [Macaca mulatta]MOW04875.1 immunoglobulin light chain junction region [Macaca mulatta]MOW05330.1 immunoglobulin light chain junction region [Macaca mulatta]MOW05581.1 immunoglobulin light chain junction region [Macaca mulatta]